MVLEDIDSDEKEEWVHSEWAHIHQKKGKILFPDILSGTDKGIFFMDKKGNQEDDIETHASRYQIIKPEYISKYIEEDEIEYSRKSTDDDKFKKLH